MRCSIEQAPMRGMIGPMRLFLPLCLCLALLPWPTSAADAILVFSRSAATGAVASC